MGHTGREGRARERSGLRDLPEGAAREVTPPAVTVAPTPQYSPARETTLSFLPPELTRWDQLTDTPGGSPELLALPFFTDERPLRGAAGLCDWRLCGRLSRLLLAGRIAGVFGETTLLPAQRLPFKRLLLFGLGPSDIFDEKLYRDSVRELRQVVARLGVRRYALALPGRSTGHIMARRALELWLDGMDAPSDVWLIEPQAAQKEMSEALGRGGRR